MQVCRCISDNAYPQGNDLIKNTLQDNMQSKTDKAEQQGKINKACKTN